MTGTKVSQLYSAQPVSKEVAEAVDALDFSIAAALNKASEAQVPQGFIVSLLHAHALEQTQGMLND